jgi:DNA mismatch repair protein MutS
MTTLPLPQHDDATPAMQQYLGVKAQHPDCLVLFQMGDFFEIFFDDAIQASKALDIALTRRGKHAGEDIPMCGVPYHAADAYIEKLMRQGFKLALCEQMEDPKQAKKRGYKAVVRREVVRILTPGTLTEETMLEAKSSQYLAALVKDKSGWAIAYTDITTGEFYSSITSPESLSSDLSRITPKELLFPESLMRDDVIWQCLKEHKQALSPQVASFFAIPNSLALF